MQVKVKLITILNRKPHLLASSQHSYRIKGLEAIFGTRNCLFKGKKYRDISDIQGNQPFAPKCAFARRCKGANPTATEI